MRTSALEYLACPKCAGSLVADGGTLAPDGHILDGRLVCGCGANYPIRGGVPRLTPEHARMTLDPEAETTASRFGAEWKIFSQRADYYEQQFLDWVQPLSPRDFTGKVVLEGGCGKGRHTSLVARYGAKAIIALDLGDAVDVAFAATRHLSNAHVVQGDVTRPPVGRCFDLAFSIGVLHHLPRPEEGFRALRDRVIEGGRISIWVYGYESNEWIVRYVNPLRTRVTSRLPEQILYWASLPPAVALTGALQLYRSRTLAKRLPYGAYLNYIARFPLREVHHIMFDQLVTPVAHYLREDQVRSWFATADLADSQLEWHNENSWRGTARVVGHAGSAAA
jgi:SAM-dependent methyltransferase